MKCPECSHENPPGVTECEECGESFYDVLMDHIETKQFERFIHDELELDTPSSSQPLLLYLPNAQKPVAIERRANLIIGRKDPESTISVDIDLAPFDAQVLGVSRQHARLDASQTPPVLTDLKSYNGTFINGKQVNADEPISLESGDEIRLGRLVTSLYYK